MPRQPLCRGQVGALLPLLMMILALLLKRDAPALVLAATARLPPPGPRVPAQAPPGLWVRLFPPIARVEVGAALQTTGVLQLFLGAPSERPPCLELRASPAATAWLALRGEGGARGLYRCGQSLYWSPPVLCTGFGGLGGWPVLESL